MKAEEGTRMTTLNEAQMRLLLTITGLTATADDLAGPLTEALGLVIESVSGNTGSIMLTNHDGLLRFSASKGLSDQTVSEVNSRGIRPGEGIAGKVAAENKPLLLNQKTITEPDLQGMISRDDIGSAICVPLTDGSKVIGVLSVNRISREVAFTDTELGMLVAVAGELYPVITRRRNMEAIYEAIVALLACQEPEEIIFPLVIIVRALMLDEISLFIVNGEHLIEVTNTKTVTSRHKIKIEIPDSSSALLLVSQTKRTAVYNQPGETKAIDPQGQPENRPFAVFPLADQNQNLIGAMIIFEKSGCQITQEETTNAQVFARCLAMQILHLRDINEQIEAQEQMIFILAAALEERSRYTSGHSRRVSELAVAVGKKLGLGDEELTLLAKGGLVHDVGKIGIPDEVLEKPDKLTEQEWTTMKQHPDLGVRIIEQGRMFSTGVARFIWCHHERPDGKGYPRGIKELTISEMILGAVDAFDAMTSRRSYRALEKEGMLVWKAILEMIRCAGTQFNIEVVRALIAALKEGITLSTDGDKTLISLTPTDCHEISLALLHRARPEADPRNRDEIPSHLATQFATLFPLN
ncbi:MAG: HD domain-containing phosphohydrolase [Patescibacteria group bacterium]